MACALSMLSSMRTSKYCKTSKKTTISDQEFDEAVNEVDVSAKLEAQEKQKTFLDYCVSQKIANQSDYNQAKKKFFDDTSDPPDFYGYIRSRGCSSVDELQVLSQTGVTTLDELKSDVKSMIQVGLSDIAGNSSLTSDELDSIISKAKINDLAKYYCSVQNIKGEGISSNIDKTLALRTLFNKFTLIPNLSDLLRDKLKLIDKKTDDYLNDLYNKLFKKIEEQKAKKVSQENDKAVDDIAKDIREESENNIDICFATESIIKEKLQEMK